MGLGGLRSGFLLFPIIHIIPKQHLALIHTLINQILPEVILKGPRYQKPRGLVAVPLDAVFGE